MNERLKECESVRVKVCESDYGDQSRFTKKKVSETRYAIIERPADYVAVNAH